MTEMQTDQATSPPEKKRPLDQLKERRLERMRQGKNVCSFEHLVSEPEFRVALVPLTEPEYLNSVRVGNELQAPNNAFEMLHREEIQRLVILRHSIRNPNDLTEHFFDSIDEILSEDSPLENVDVNHLFDCYLEMTHDLSPSLEGLTAEDFDELKKVWHKIEWSELSGTQWYAAKRLVNSIWPNLLRASVPGSFSTSSSTPTNMSETSVLNAIPSETNDDAKDAETS